MSSVRRNNVIKGLLLKQYLSCKRDKKFLLLTVLFPMMYTVLITVTLVMQNSISSNSNNDIKTVFDLTSTEKYLFPLSYIDRQYSTSGMSSSSTTPSLNFDRNVLLNQIVFTMNERGEDQSTKFNQSLLFVRESLSKVQKEYISYNMKEPMIFESLDGMNRYLMRSDVNAVLIGVAFNKVELDTKTFDFTLLYNGTNDRTLPQFHHVLTLAMTQLAYERDSSGSVARVDFEIPLLYTQQVSIATIQDTNYLDTVIYSLMFGMVFLIPMYTQNVVAEVEKGLKHQLLLSGVSPVMYWLSKYCFDYLIYVVVAVLQYICIGLIGKAPAFTQNSQIVLIYFYVIYGLNIASFSYLFSFIFKKAEDAAKWAGGFVSLSITVIFILVKFVFHFDTPVLANIFLSLLPSYSFFYGLAVFGFAAMKDEPITIRSLFSVGTYGGTMAVILLIITLQALIFTAIIIMLEWLKHVSKRPNGLFNNSDKLMKQIESGESNESEAQEEEEDEDVARERERVSSTEEDNDILRIVNVHKVYKQKKILKHAVDGVHIGVQKGVCFGLLGPNGAGKVCTSLNVFFGDSLHICTDADIHTHNENKKTSLIDVLSGIHGANRGNVYINHHNIFSQPNQAYASLGVCAQTDRLWDKLTVRDHIRIFCMLRGVYTQENIQHVIDEFQMNEVADQETVTLSGGQKRKLSVALAFIGEPSVVMLDEPSSGMDVATRRLLWNKILTLKEERAIVLTSHSMEEVDALCSQVGIMVNGRLRCLGSSQHLKSKFGSGYRLSISSAFPLRTQEWVSDVFRDSKLTNEVAHMQHYEIPKSDTVTLSYMFEQVELMKEELKIPDYSISEATLEDIFISFAKKQSD